MYMGLRASPGAVAALAGHSGFRLVGLKGSGLGVTGPVELANEQ